MAPICGVKLIIAPNGNAEDDRLIFSGVPDIIVTLATRMVVAPGSNFVSFGTMDIEKSRGLGAGGKTVRRSVVDCVIPPSVRPVRVILYAPADVVAWVRILS